MAIIKRFSLILLTCLILVNIGFAETEIYFGPNGGAKEAIIKHIKNSKSSIKIAIFDFTDKDIANALKEVNERWVDVEIIMDNRSAHGHKSVYNFLNKRKITNIKIPQGACIAIPHWQIKLQRGGHGGIMHHKFVVFDNTCVLTGSTNWSNGGFNCNRENAIFIDDPAVIKIYSDYFDKLWEQ